MATTHFSTAHRLQPIHTLSVRAMGCVKGGGKKRKQVGVLGRENEVENELQNS